MCHIVAWKYIPHARSYESQVEDISFHWQGMWVLNCIRAGYGTYSTGLVPESGVSGPHADNPQGMKQPRDPGGQSRVRKEDEVDGPVWQERPKKPIVSCTKAAKCMQKLCFSPQGVPEDDPSVNSNIVSVFWCGYVCWPLHAMFI